MIRAPARPRRASSEGATAPARAATPLTGSSSFHPTLAMVLATLLWGATFVVLRDTVRRIPPVTLVCARFAAATPIFAILLAARRAAPGRDALLGGAIAGVFNAAGYLFQAVGLTQVSAGTSAFLTSAGTLLAGLFAWPLLGQRPTRILALGLALAGAGSFLLAGRVELRWGSGEAWSLIGSAAFALQVVAVARFVGLGRADPMALAGVQALTVAVLLAPFAARAGIGIAALAPGDLWRLSYLVVAGSVIAPWLQMRSQRALSAGRVGLLFALEPVFALGFALSFGGERFRPHWWWGAAFILAGVALVEGRAGWASARSRRASG